MTFAIKPPLLIALFHPFFTLHFSFAIESHIYETVFTFCPISFLSPLIIGSKLTLFPVAEREQIVYHVTDNLRLACLQPSTNFLTNMTIETFHAGHLGRHLATTSREMKAANRSDRTDRQSSLTFQDTCVGQHSQFLRCFPGDGP